MLVDKPVAANTDLPGSRAFPELAKTRALLHGRSAVGGVQIDAPITAFYWWKSKVQTAQERRISYMTTTDRLPALKAWMHEQHPYDVPQWITLPVTGGSEAYLSWVAEETAQG